MATIFTMQLFCGEWWADWWWQCDLNFTKTFTLWFGKCWNYLWSIDYYRRECPYMDTTQLFGFRRRIWKDIAKYKVSLESLFHCLPNRRMNSKKFPLYTLQLSRSFFFIASILCTKIWKIRDFHRDTLGSMNYAVYVHARTHQYV